MTKKDDEAISAAFADMVMYGRGFTRMKDGKIEHIPFHEAMDIDAKREGSVMCNLCQRQIQRCICDAPNDAPLDTGPNAP